MARPARLLGVGGAVVLFALGSARAKNAQCDDNYNKFLADGCNEIGQFGKMCESPCQGYMEVAAATCTTETVIDEETGEPANLREKAVWVLDVCANTCKRTFYSLPAHCWEDCQEPDCQGYFDTIKSTCTTETDMTDEGPEIIRETVDTFLQSCSKCQSLWWKMPQECWDFDKGSTCSDHCKHHVAMMDEVCTDETYMAEDGTNGGLIRDTYGWMKDVCRPCLHALKKFQDVCGENPKRAGGCDRATPCGKVIQDWETCTNADYAVLHGHSLPAFDALETYLPAAECGLSSHAPRYIFNEYKSEHKVGGDCVEIDEDLARRLNAMECPGAKDRRAGWA